MSTREDRAYLVSVRGEEFARLLTDQEAMTLAAEFRRRGQTAGPVPVTHPTDGVSPVPTTALDSARPGGMRRPAVAFGIGAVIGAVIGWAVFGEERR